MHVFSSILHGRLTTLIKAYVVGVYVSCVLYKPRHQVEDNIIIIIIIMIIIIVIIIIIIIIIKMITK